MNKAELIEKLKANDLPSKEKLISWVTCLPGSTASKKPKKSKVGDVYMHPIFQHPYILLENRKEYWICGLLTTESKCPEILEPVKSRFFEGYITKTMFTASEIVGAFANPYDNPKHIREIREKLKSIFK
jgi:hypothetical protein